MSGAPLAGAALVVVRLRLPLLGGLPASASGLAPHLVLLGAPRPTRRTPPVSFATK